MKECLRYFHSKWITLLNFCYILYQQINKRTLICFETILAKALCLDLALALTYSGTGDNYTMSSVPLHLIAFVFHAFILQQLDNDYKGTISAHINEHLNRFKGGNMHNLHQEALEFCNLSPAAKAAQATKAEHQPTATPQLPADANNLGDARKQIWS